MSNNNDSVDENRPGTSLNKKRGHRSDDGISNKSSNQFNREKQSTAQGSRRGNQQYFDIRGSSSQSQFRTVNMTQSFYNQAQRDLGFNAPGSRHDFSKTMSSFHKGSMIGGAFASKDYTKVIPKNIIYDKEVLYDELLKSKSSQNLLVQENHSLKTKLSGMKEEMFRICKKEQVNPFETDVGKYKQVFKEQMSLSQNVNRANSATLVLTLKKQVTELQTDVQQKDQALQKIQRSVKLTSIKELEVQLKMYSEECLRLRRMLEQQMKLEKDERFKNEASQMEGTPRGSGEQQSNYNSAFSLLKQDNIQMAANLKKQEEEIFAQRIVIETLEKQLRNQKHDSQQQRRIIQEKNREIESFKGNDPFANNGKKSSQFTVEGQLKIEIEKKQQEINAFSHQLQQKDKRFMDLEKKSREKEADLLDKISAEIKEKQDLQNLLDKERDVVFKLRQDIERFNQQDRRFTKGDIISSQATMNDIDNGDSTNRNFNSRKSVRQNTNISVRSYQNASEMGTIASMARKRLAKVNVEEIQQIGEDLKYKLKLQRISLNQLEKYLFKDEISRVQEISLQEIYNTIQEYPFKISDENQLLALSRYLIEDNSQDWIIFDPNLTNSTSVVKSVLRHLLDNYTIPSQQQEMRELVKITTTLNKAKGALIDMLQRDPASRKVNGVLCCDKKQLVYVLDQLEMTLSASEMDMMCVKLYEDNLNLNSIKIDSIFKIFNQDKYNNNTEQSMKDLQENPQAQQGNYKQNSFNEFPKQDSKGNLPAQKKNSLKNEGSKSQLSNKSKPFKNMAVDFNVYNSNVDQEAVAANQNNYLLEDEEEVESQGQISNDDESQQNRRNPNSNNNSNHQQRQQNQRNNMNSNNNNNNNNNNHGNSSVNYLNIAQEHEQLQGEQTNYTQKTNDMYQESNED